MHLKRERQANKEAKIKNLTPEEIKKRQEKNQRKKEKRQEKRKKVEANY
jgi:hypothetical protein